MKNFIILLVATMATMNNYAQDCGTEDIDSATITQLPWFGNNTWLNNFVDSIEAPFNCTNCRTGDGPSKTLYQIPINAVVYYNSTYPDISNSKIEALINEVNKIYETNGILIKLYLRCNIKHIYSTYAYLSSTQAINDLLGLDNEPNCIDVHFSNFAPSLHLCGMAKLPNAASDRYSCLINYDCGSNSLAHEIGHNLGLPHTFNKNNCRNNCFQECVSRTRTQEGYCFLTIGKKKCEVNGDCFCDTDADIRDGDNYKGQYANCSNNTYDVSATNTLPSCKKYDNYGEQWYKPGYTNAMHNIMSYWDCEPQFSKMQRGAMYLFAIKNGLIPAQNNNSVFYSNADVDAYENDNLFDPALDTAIDNKMPINTRQYHTFHLNNGNTNACDIDWVYIAPYDWQTGQAFPTYPTIVQTQEVAGKPKPDTKIIVYAIDYSGNLVQVAQHDNISANNLFSYLSFNPYIHHLLDSQFVVNKYAIKIENNITTVSDVRSKGHYYLRVDRCYDKTNVAITGDNYICTSKQYSVSNIPVGAVVTWSAEPPIYTNITTTNNVATVTQAGSGTTTLKATISYCGETYLVTKENIKVGLPYVQYAYQGCNYPIAAVEPGTEEGPCNSQCYSPSQSISWCAGPVYNATSVTWQKTASIPANYNFWSGSWSGNNNFVHVMFKMPNQYVELKTTMTNVCGSIEQYYCFNSTTTLCSGRTGNQILKAYPNPASAENIITLELFVEEQQIDFENCIIQLIDDNNKVVFEKPGNKEIKEQLKIPSVSSGKYYINVTNNYGTVSEELMINNPQ